MNMFAKLSEISDRNKSRSSLSEGANVALVVSGYDLAANTVSGHSLATGEEITIGLRPDKDADKRSHPRAEVKNWSAKRDKAATAIGGVILFEGVYLYQHGYTARWGTAISHDADEASVFIAQASPLVGRNGSVGFHLLRLPAAAPVNSRDELVGAVAEALAPSTFAEAVVRVTDGARVLAERVRRFRKVGGEIQPLSPEEAAGHFLETEFGKVLLQELAGGGCLTEVIPAERIYAGKETKKRLAAPGAIKRYQMGPELGYTDTVVAVRQHEEGGIYLTAAMPTSTHPKVFSLEGLSSPNIRPKVAPVVNPPKGDGHEEDGGLEGAHEVESETAPNPSGPVVGAAPAAPARASGPAPAQAQAQAPRSVPAAADSRPEAQQSAATSAWFSPPADPAPAGDESAAAKVDKAARAIGVRP